jgi:hypothetical protein
MIIDKKFSLITYAGSKPLNLMAKDTEIANDTTKNNEWDKFIQSIDTIYASQSINNTIPVFWTRRFSVNDRFGNILFRYEPHPESSLKQLDSKSAYYCILRDSSSAPVKIPSHGPLVLGYSDASDLPYVFPPLEDVTLDKTSFKYSFKPQIINLKQYENYTYSWKVVSSNWPVAANALSGTLKPASATGTINSIISFCPTTGECSDNILQYSLPSECSLESLDNPYVTLQLSVKPESTLIESLSDQFTITCNDCLPKPRINIESISENNIVEDPSDSAPAPFYDFRLNFNNLEINQTYNYSIDTLYSEWPIVFSSPISGSFTVNSLPAPFIYGKIFFCPTTGLCVPNGTTIPSYVVPNYPKFLTSDINHNITLRASLSYTNDCGSAVYYSDLNTITYKRS